MGLGSYPEVSLSAARVAAEEARQLKAKGVDPIDTRAAGRALKIADAAKAVTFRHCAHAYIDAREDGWHAKHAAQWRATLETYAMPTLGSLPVAAIDVTLVHGVLEPIWKTKTETASRLRGRIEAVLDWAATRGAWIERNFCFIDTDPTGTGDSDQPFDLQWIIDRATDAVLRDGIRVLLIDPFNELDSARARDETVTDYIARCIRALKRFARLYGVVVIVVAHPTKEVGKGGVARTVTLYDIEGSAAQFNKCDHGIVIERADHNSTQCTVYIQKSRFEEAGRKATMLMDFNQEAMRFIPLDTGYGAAA